jgi:ABC-2 type transport system ATP-binding protein
MVALLHRPEVLFLDEPTLGLDVNAQAAVRAFLKRYNEETGATILLTSHYMADITALCSRVLVIHDGRLIFDGDLKRLTSRFAPEKRIELELSGDVTPADVARATAAVAGDDRCGSFRHTGTEGRLVRFAVDPQALAPALQRLLAVLVPSDLSVTDPPIDDVIGRAISGDAPAAVDGAAP